MTAPTTFGPVYPQLDANGVSLVVYAEDGTTQIPPVTGAIVPNTKYYTDLVRIYGQLTLSNPLASSGDPVTVPPITRVSGSTIGALTSQLFTLPIVSDGEQVTTVGALAALDGGAGSFRAALGVSAGADGRDKINTVNGQWQRVPDASELTMKGSGCVMDGVTPDQAPLTAFMNAALATPGSEVSLLPSRVVVGLTQVALADTVILTGRGGARFKGHGGHTQDTAGVRFVWVGPSDRPMFSLRTYGAVFENIEFYVAQGHTMQQFVDMKSGATVCSKPTFCNVSFKADAQGAWPASGNYLYAVTAGFDGTALGNCEDATFVDCSFYDFDIAGVRLFPGPQPYTWTWQRGLFFNANRPNTHGVGVWNDNGSSNCRFDTVNFTALEAATYGIQPNQLWNCQSERCKRGYNGDGSTGTASPVVFVGGRFATEGTTMPSTGPAVISAADPRWIVQGGAGPVTMLGGAFSSTGTPQPWKAQAQHGPAPLVSLGNVFNNMDPFDAVAANSDAERPGGVYSFGDKGVNASNAYENLLPRWGCVNPDAAVVFTEDFSSIHVNHLAQERTNTYLVDAFVTSYTGTPGAGALRVRCSAKSREYFVLELDAEPAAGATVTVGYKLRLADQPAALVVSETCIATDTLRATANPGGIQGSPGGFWVAALFHLTAAHTIDQWLASNGFTDLVAGWALELRQGPGLGVNFRYATAGTSYRTPYYTFQASDIGKTHLAVGVYNGAGSASLYFNRVLIGTVTGSAFTSGAGRTVIMGSTTYAGAFRLSEGAMLGLAGGNAVPNLSQVQAYFDDVKTAGQIVSMAGVSTAKRYKVDGRSSLAEDVSGSDSITLVSGAATKKVFQKLNWWGW